MASIVDELSIANPVLHSHKEGDSGYWISGQCSFCGPTQFYMVAATADKYNRYSGETAWLRCATCKRGHVINSGVLSPTAAALPTVDGLPENVNSAWEEVRSCQSVAAHTASVMMCRKILFHIAVEKGMQEKNAKGWAPNFTETLEYLKAQGLVTPLLVPWVEHIKNIGNEANHDLAQITADSAQRVATFTRQLLVLTYEMPAQMSLAVDEGPDDLDDPGKSLVV